MKMPPQLPPPRKKIAKDAAQAVKRVDSLTTQAVTIETLQEFIVEEVPPEDKPWREQQLTWPRQIIDEQK